MIFTGSNTPGEGEHKIIAFIRKLKSENKIEANTKHCLYGLDADLIMLALVLHEPYIVLLREAVKLGWSLKKCERKTIYANEKFAFLFINIVREYLEKEFEELQKNHNFNMERIIDDFVFICFFVGNDFVPRLPTIDIEKGIINHLIDAYKKNFWKFEKTNGGFLT